MYKTYGVLLITIDHHAAIYCILVYLKSACMVILPKLKFKISVFNIILLILIEYLSSVGLFDVDSRSRISCECLN